MTLLEPYRLGRHTLRNRIVFGPHETNLGRRRSISERHVAYYRRRAAGGTGLVIVEEASVDASDWPYERCPLATDCKPGWTEVARVVHDEGSVVLAAIGHAGGQGSSAYSQLPLLAPSRVPDVVSREVPKFMETHEIERVVAAFAGATMLAVDAGMDGVDVNAGQFSLLRQFLSGLTNHRLDGYGTDRLLFARQVLEGVRDAAGSAVVGLRLSCDEMAPWAGIVPETGAAIAVALAPLVDLVTVVRGSIYTAGATRPDGHTPPGFNLALAAAVRAALPPRVAVVLQGSVVDVSMADDSLAAGGCDLVEMTRSQIADPDLVAKVAAGIPERVRPCILCNQVCQVRDNRNPIVTCVGEPASGHELEDEPVTGRAMMSKKVTVVGGGPAGLEAARVAATRGHDVRLVERSERVGGAVHVAAAGPGRERLALMVDWLESECRAAGVHIETDQEVTSVPAEGETILCTGGRSSDVTPGLSARAYLGGATALPPGQGTVVVIDEVGGPVAVAVAERIVATGRAVTFVTSDLVVGTLLARTGDMGPANTRLHQGGVEMVKRALLRGVEHVDGGEVVVIEDRFSGARRSIRADAVVVCSPEVPDDELWHATGQQHAIAGDAVAPRTILEAVLEGRRAALALERR